MRLSRFIREHSEEILVEWESFARTLRPAASGMSASELRDHGYQMLMAIAADIDTHQSDQEQEDKARGMAPQATGPASAASLHGTLREFSGFTLLQLTAEFRALRASVMRLWLPYLDHVSGDTSNDILRFNEAIDQALAESAVTYSLHAGRARDMFLAILGHDLRSPLAAMSSAGHALTMPSIAAEQTLRVGQNVKRSAAMMTSMVNDLLEYARTQLGGKMPLKPTSADMGDICRAALHDSVAAHPRCRFDADITGNLVGQFDPVRLQQVVTNLLNNAAQFADKEEPIRLLVSGDANSVTVEVRNRGPVIPAQSLDKIFSALVQLDADDDETSRPTTSLGLGLYVAREATLGHGGSIDVISNETDGTIFTVRYSRDFKPPHTPPAG